MPQFSLIPSDESRELADDIRALFDELASSLEHEQRAYSGECHPAIDVLETATALEIVVDVSGVSPDAIRVLFRNGVVIVAGEKAPSPTTADQSFHLVEREFGRFARVIRVSGAFDVQRAQGSVQRGVLTIVLPKRADRRGHRIPIAVTPQRQA